ncbi:hypothetical protein WH47_03765 [Habropoda laboriosa]|uniref:Uncharacterized protein n=1 Tax=Habropoda laboriosa TaxID=597456 RepID=A0A0L7QW37_9HYME|nr:hypothetical protein WH47_03765 [Habropoda laboriosa]
MMENRKYKEKNGDAAWTKDDTSKTIPPTGFRPMEKAHSGIQLPYEILANVLKADCTVAVM